MLVPGKIHICILLATITMAVVIPATAQDDNVLVRKGSSVITHELFDARIGQIPEKDRIVFVRDGGQVERLLGNMLLIRQVADHARENGYDRDPQARLLMEFAADQKLADMWINKQLADAPIADFEQLALERYMVNPERFVSEPTVDVSHILISTESRPDEEALALAEDLFTRLEDDPGQFENLVQEYSEDPSASANGGLFKGVKRGVMVPPFENAAFQMQEPGELSAPVKTQYGFHILRLEKFNPSQPLSFEDVKTRLIEQSSANHGRRVRSDFMNKFSQVPLVIPPGAIETMLKRYFGEDLENAPDYSGIMEQKP